MRAINIFELLILAAIWGASFVFMRVAVPEFGAIPLIGVRVGVAALILLPFFIAKHPIRQLAENKLSILFVGIFNAALPFSLFAYSTIYLSAGLAAIINAATAIFTALVAFLWLGENLSLKRIAGLFIGFFGVCALVYSAGGLDNRATLLAVLAGLTATVSYAVNICFTKLYCSEISPLRLTTASMLVGFLLLLPFMIYLWPEQAPSVRAWVSAIILGVVCTGFALVMFFRLLVTLGPSPSALVTLLVPLFGAIWGAIWLGESMTIAMLISGALILLGTALASKLLGK